MTLEEYRVHAERRMQQQLARARAELHEHARRIQEENAQLWDERAAMARKSGDDRAALRYERWAAEERAETLPV